MVIVSHIDSTLLHYIFGEREARQAGAAAPEASIADRRTAFSEEMLKITKQNEDLRVEITALRSHEARQRAASDTTTMFRDFMVQQTAINSPNKLRRRNCPKRCRNL